MTDVHIQPATDHAAWETFLTRQRFCPFLQSWTMGEVYRDIGQEPVRIEARQNDDIVGICQAIVVPARRGRHLMVQYGPIARDQAVVDALLNALKEVASEYHCSFIRVSPFWPESSTLNFSPGEALPARSRTDGAKRGQFSIPGALDSPLHLLSEYTWYIPLRTVDRWQDDVYDAPSDARPEDDIKAAMRKTTRNLIGRAEREGVTVDASSDPMKDLEIYFELQKETYKRHHFVPYRDSFIRAQVKHFAPQEQAIVYVARYQGEPVAASVHMSYGGTTSYHHGASTHKHAKIPASYLLQWTAISEALHREDDIYNFWGIAPRRMTGDGREEIIDPKHPFAGVTTFKTGFGGKPLPLTHCMDIPLSAGYRITRAFEFARKWKRGF